MTAFKRSETVTQSTSLVTTDTAQTITGVKTFSNGMKGRTDGNTPLAEYIGEVITQGVSFSQASPSLNTLYTASTLTIPTSGVWLVNLSGTLYRNSASTGTCAEAILASGTGSISMLSTSSSSSIGVTTSGEVASGINCYAIVRTSGSCTILAQIRSTNLFSSNTATSIQILAGSFTATRIA